MMRTWILGIAAFVLLAAAPPPMQVDRMVGDPLVVPASAAAVAARCDALLAAAGAAQQALETGTAKPGIASVFAPNDDLGQLLSTAANESYLVAQTNPDKGVRTAAEACTQRAGDFATTLSLSRPIFARLSAIATAGLDADTAQVLGRTLLEYCLGGVDKDAATRARVEAAGKQITATGLKFDGNIRDLKGVTLLDPADLVGMPQDYIDAHKPGPDGKVRISTDYPDTLPIFDFADKESTRKAVYLTYINRAWPQNGPVLKDLLSERAALAGLLGYPHFSDLALADRMAQTPAKATAFIDRVNDAATPGGKIDFAEDLARWQKIDPHATTLQRWNVGYVERLLRKEKYQADSAEIRRYFTYTKARGGIFQLVHDLFGSDIRPWNTPVWNKDVTAWSLYDGATLIGHFYLDPHPREGKYGHAAEFPITVGVEGRVIPVAALVTNFPATGPMEHDDVETFLHEFGHLIHFLYSGHHRWYADNMGNIESDFIEAPSQFLEEWVWDYDTLSHFASDPDGRPIPRELVAKMNKARFFGQGARAKGQIAYAAISLDYYTKPPATLDLDRDWQTMQEKYSLFPYIPGTHGWAAFGHLSGYSASYYTYIWSGAIALDLFTRFQQAGMRDPATAMAYRREVLEPGASKPAATLVSDFLGRPWNLDALRTRLQQR